MFFQAARRGNNAFYRYLLTILCVFIAALIGQIPLVVAVGVATSKDGLGAGELEAFQQSMDFSILGIGQNLALFFVLLAFAAALGMLYLCVRFLHRKRFTDILTGRQRLDWKRVGFSFGFWMVLSGALEVVGYLQDPGNYTWQFNLRLFLPLLLISLVMLPLQTTFEEAIFRGYLMQGLGLLFRNRWLPLLLTSVAFGALHIANPEIKQFGLGLMMPYYIGFGLLMGICTLMDEGTELALGLHAATNIYGATVVSFAGSALQTPALFRLGALDTSNILPASLAISLFFLMVAARRYGWHGWGRLFGKLSFEPEPSADEPADEENV
ncbi:MAG: CPBP family intramembrane metalloprotease [Phaeodactylibacter sp.]|nr:CPBP family intramembrane metalloprotease [Phaeodactylibacter sp.]MCB9274737.1 CPBP family intramembrane metalloprotease [Lewinellaceae bacterium]